MARTGCNGSTNSAPSRACARIFITARRVSSLAANSGTSQAPITSPKGNVIFGPWRDTEYYLSVGQGFHSNDLRGAVTTVDALRPSQSPARPRRAAGRRRPLLTKATGYEIGIRADIMPKLNAAAALFVLDLDSEATFNGDEAGTQPGRPEPAHRDRSQRHLHAARVAAVRRRFRLHPRALSPMPTTARPTPSPAIPAAISPARPR